MTFRFFLGRFVALTVLLSPLGCDSQPLPVEAPPSARPWSADPVELQELHQHVYFLASDALEGRMVGTHGLDDAADYLAVRFRALGLRTLPGCDRYFQPFQYTLSSTVGEKTALHAGAAPLMRGKDFTSLPISAAGDFSGPGAFVGYGITDASHSYDDYAGLDVKGRVVLAMRFEPHDGKGTSRFTKGTDWSNSAALMVKAQNAAQHGAAALLLLNPANFHGPDYLMPATLTGAVGRARIPVLQVRQSVAEDLLKRAGVGDLKSLQSRIDADDVPHSLELTGSAVSGTVELIRKQTIVKNVVAYLPGFGPRADEFIVVGAHYDHLGRGGAGSLAFGSRAIHYGADDNASGTAAVLEMAMHLTQAGRLERSVIFVCFTAEEEGLIGSQHFVDHPPVPLAKIVAMVNLDMVGRIRNQQLFVGGAGTASAFDGMLTGADAGLPLKLKQAGPYIGRGGFGPSDHMSFALKKIPVLFLFSGMHSDYHTPGDVAGKVNFTGIDETVDLGSALVDAIAAAPRQPYVGKYDSQLTMSSLGGGTGSHAALGVVPDYASDDNAPGVRITGTRSGSPAEAAGLKDGDIIVAIGATPITTLQELSDFLASAKPGDKVKVVIVRSKQRVETNAVLSERKG